MNLYFVERTTVGDYDTYSDFVCAAPSEQEAAKTHPSQFGWCIITWDEDAQTWKHSNPANGTFHLDLDDDGNPDPGDWVLPSQVVVKYLGVAAPEIKAGVICSSYHAG